MIPTWIQSRAGDCGDFLHRCRMSESGRLSGGQVSSHTCNTWWALHCNLCSHQAERVPHFPHGLGVGPQGPAHTVKMMCSSTSCSLSYRPVHSSTDLFTHESTTYIFLAYGVHMDVLEAHGIFILVHVAAKRTQKCRTWQPAADTLTQNLHFCKISRPSSHTSQFEKGLVHCSLQTVSAKGRVACHFQSCSLLCSSLIANKKPRDH